MNQQIKLILEQKIKHNQLQSSFLLAEAQYLFHQNELQSFVQSLDYNVPEGSTNETE